MTKLAQKICLTMLSLTAISSTALADTYRWIDDNGVVNYSELKPRGIAAERVTEVASGGAGQTSNRQTQPTPRLPTQASRTDSGSSTSEPLTNNQEEMLQRLQLTEATRQQEIAEIRQDNCERSKRVLANLTAKDRIRIREDDGSQRAMPEDERQTGIANAQEGIVRNCDA